MDPTEDPTTPPTTSEEGGAAAEAEEVERWEEMVKVRLLVVEGVIQVDPAILVGCLEEIRGEIHEREETLGMMREEEG